ncbi:MAG: hypothetical protein HY755_12490 [Nitrospirae bacterium]|nr:hypothetical protein [Nitrospirota bacterium]
MHALSLEDGNGISDRADTDPCRFLLQHGCSLPRYKRPFRCTWFFCERLLASMDKDKPKEYRAFIAAFENLQRLRQKLLKTNDI